MKESTRTIILAVTCLILAVMALVQYNQSSLSLAHAEQSYVYAICNTAHDELNGESEDKCADAQDRTHTEFLCNQTNTKCWVEAN